MAMASIETIVDDAGKMALIDAKGRMRGFSKKERKCDANGRFRWKEIWNEGTDAVMDIPLAGVCEVLYGEGRIIHDENEETTSFVPSN